MAGRHPRGAALPPADLVLNAAGLALATPLVARSGGRDAAGRALSIFALGAAAERVAIAALRRGTGTAPAPADLLTLSRATAGTLLLAVAVAGPRCRTDPAARLAFVAALLGATVADWLDGPLARRRGPTVAGAVLDIEADSWLTLTAAIAAVRRGGLSRWSLVPPALRYLTPIAARRRGEWFAGGGAWRDRALGAAQMATFFAALAPIEPPLPPRLLRRAGLAVAALHLAEQATEVGKTARRRDGK